MSGQLRPFGQVMTFWTLASLYVASGEHSRSLFARGQSSQRKHFCGALLTQVLVPGARGSVVSKQHPVLTEVRLWQGEVAKTLADREQIPSGGLP